MYIYWDPVCVITLKFNFIFSCFLHIFVSFKVITNTFLIMKCKKKKCIDLKFNKFIKWKSFILLFLTKRTKTIIFSFLYIFTIYVMYTNLSFIFFFIYFIYIYTYDNHYHKHPSESKVKITWLNNTRKRIDMQQRCSSTMQQHIML